MQSRRVLIPIDNTETAAHVIKFASTILTKSDEIILFHVYYSVYDQSNSILTGKYQEAMLALADENQKVAQELLEKHIKTLTDMGYNCRGIIQSGNIKVLIDDTIKKEDIDLVVMGKRSGLNPVSRLLLGSVSSHVLNTAHIPVAVCP
ncbi:hypothetical protein HDV01_002728 [Terramyces sp. JEL0728]|nr:hypothetical protein HDV01_002728 [Terramyces sp. JEL0728]